MNKIYFDCPQCNGVRQVAIVRAMAVRTLYCKGCHWKLRNLINYSYGLKVLYKALGDVYE